MSVTIVKYDVDRNVPIFDFWHCQRLGCHNTLPVRGNKTKPWHSID